jgi:Tfp pilus assembly protein PilX
MNSIAQNTSNSNKRKNQEGAALVIAVFAILIATLIGFALHYSAYVSQAIAINDRNNTEALYLADAGVNHALILISKVPKADFSKILIAGANTTQGTGDELSVPPTTGLWTTAQSIPAGSKTSGGVTGIGAGGAGRYWVSVKNDTATGETATTDTNGILIVTSTGIGRDGATSTVEATVFSKTVSYPAVLINGKAKIAGSVSVEGTNGILHSNDTLRIDGAPCADQYFSTAADIINASKLKGSNCSGAGVNRYSQPVIEPPVYDVRNDFYGKTTYILGAIGAQAGKVYTGTGVLVANTTTTSNTWTNSDGSVWTWSPSIATWIQSGTKITSASYYSEGNIAITGNFGTKAAPAKVSFFAEGFIYNQGKQYLTPHYSGITLMAGTDILLRGKFTADADDLEAEGITYANHQIDFAGTPVLNGIVIAANRADTNSYGCNCNLVPLDSSGFMSINGNVTVISNGGNTIEQGASVVSWREVRY